MAACCVAGTHGASAAGLFAGNARSSRSISIWACANEILVVGGSKGADGGWALIAGAAAQSAGMPAPVSQSSTERKSIVEGQQRSVRGDLGGGRSIKKKTR